MFEFLVMILFKILMESPNSLRFTTKKYFESSSRWSFFEPVTIITLFVLKSTSVGCFSGSLYPSLHERLYSGLKKVFKQSLYIIYSAMLKFNVV